MSASARAVSQRRIPATTTSSPTTVNSPTGRASDWSSFQRERTAKLQAQRPVLLARYGLSSLTDAQVAELLQAEAELEVCRNCTGSESCARIRPSISTIGGELHVTYELCEWGVKRQREHEQYAAAKAEHEQKLEQERHFATEFTIDRTLANFKKFKAYRRRLMTERYDIAPTLTDDQIYQLYRADECLQLCATCSKDFCQKLTAHYERPEIKIVDGIPHVSYSLCPVKKIRRCKWAQIPDKYLGRTFDDYEVTRDNQRAVHLAKAYIKKKPKDGLYLYGACGTGKTFLASLIAQEFVADDRWIIFGDVPSLLDNIKTTFNSNQSTQEILDNYYTCDLLILDDVGAGYLKDWGVGQIYEMVNERYNAGLPVIVTSNLDLDGLEQRLSVADALAGKRIVSRIYEMCTPVFFGTNDRRRL